MTWIKICGITNLEDARTAVEAGADALGFVFYEKSPRNVGPGTVREILKELRGDPETVGVFVGGLNGQFVEMANHAGLKSMQIHNSESATAQEIFIPFDLRTYPCLPMSALLEDELLLERTERHFTNFSRYKRTGDGDLKFTVFLDSSTVEHPGGTGKVFDWQKAVPLIEIMRRSVNVVVAGGLTPANVTEAIRILKPWGVDVSSGVEARPGKKDPEKMRAFIAAVRKAEKNL